MWEEQTPLLDVRDLNVSFSMYNQAFEKENLQVISNLCLNVKKGEILAIAGSSGSGKSLLTHAIMGLLPNNAEVSGSIKYNGIEMTDLIKKSYRGKKIALVPQSISYLDPLMKVGKQAQGSEKGEYGRKKQRKAFERYNLCEKSEKMFPYQLSGGMARRVLISTAVINDVELIIADEPTPGLDLENALIALEHFRELADVGKAIILITHDIDLAFNFADKIAVFYAGTTVEISPAKDFIEGEHALRHPYTKALFKALPQNGFVPIDGFQPYFKDLPKGCLFSDRCVLKTIECEQKIPMKNIRGGMVRCVHAT